MDVPLVLPPSEPPLSFIGRYQGLTHSTDDHQNKLRTVELLTASMAVWLLLIVVFPVGSTSSFPTASSEIQSVSLSNPEFLTVSGTAFGVFDVLIKFRTDSSTPPSVILSNPTAMNPSWSQVSGGWIMTETAATPLNNTGGPFPFDQYEGMIVMFTNSSFTNLGPYSVASTSEGFVPLASNFLLYGQIAELNRTVPSVNFGVSQTIVREAARAYPSSSHVYFMLIYIQHPPDFWLSVITIAGGTLTGLSVLTGATIWLLIDESRKRKLHKSAPEVGGTPSDFPSNFLTTMVISVFLFVPLFWFSVRSLESPIPVTWIDYGLLGIVATQLSLSIAIIINKLGKGLPRRSTIRSVFVRGGREVWRNARAIAFASLLMIGMFPLPFARSLPLLILMLEAATFSTYYSSIALLTTASFLGSFLLLVPKSSRRPSRSLGLEMIGLGSLFVTLQYYQNLGFSFLGFQFAYPGEIPGGFTLVEWLAALGILLVFARWVPLPVARTIGQASSSLVARVGKWVRRNLKHVFLPISAVLLLADAYGAYQLPIGNDLWVLVLAVALVVSVVRMFHRSKRPSRQNQAAESD